MKSFADCRLYTFVDTAYLGRRPAAEVTRQLCDGGADLVQIRAKGAGLDEIQRLIDEILPVTRAANVWCVLNDHAELGRERGVPCVHLGQEDFFDDGKHTTAVELWRSDTKTDPIHPTPALGLSSHAPAQALRAAAAGADYVAIGPVFPTGTKPGRAAVTLEYVRWATKHLSLPWFAIGGINLGNLKQVIDAGAQRICVVSAILNAANIAATTAAFRRELGA